MLDIIGSGYVIDHCVSAFRKDEKELAYRVYISNMLKAIVEQNGGTVYISFVEMLDELDKPLNGKEQENDANAIVNRIRRKLS